jgi:hypothetical protein
MSKYTESLAKEFEAKEVDMALLMKSNGLDTYQQIFSMKHENGTSASSS